MAINLHDIGGLYELSGAWTNLNGDPADPVAVTFKVRQPDGTEIEYVYGTDAEVVKDSVGNYHVNFAPTMSGLHTYRYDGEGAVTMGKEHPFVVERTVFS